MSAVRRISPVDRALIAASLAYTALYLLWLVFRWGGPDLELALSDLSFLPLGGLAVAIALRAGRGCATRRGRRAWYVFAAAFAAYLIGDTCWFLVEVVMAQEVPAASFVDLGYLAFFPFAFAAVIALPGLRREGRLISALDIAIVTAGTGTVVWVLALAPTAASSGSSVLETLVALAYPIGDMVVLFALAVAFGRRLTETSRLTIAALGVGLLLNITCDLVWTRLQLEGAYASGGIIDAGYMVGWLAMAFAAYTQTERNAGSSMLPFRVPDLAAHLPSPGISLPLMPCSAIALLDAILLAVAWQSGGDLFVLVVGAIVVTGLVVGRQVVTAQEHADGRRDERRPR